MKQALRKVARGLGQALRLTPEMAAYRAAMDDYQRNAALMAKLRRFQTLRQEFQQVQYRGGATQEPLDELRSLQDEINNHPAVTRVLEAQEATNSAARQANEIIRQVLGVDFAANAGGGGCCG